jgi:hypothetical protein
MRVVIHARVEIAFRSVDHDLVHQPRFAKRAQRVVDGRQRHLLARLIGQREQAFRRHMPVLTIAHQQRGKGKPLPRRAQSAPRQPLCPSILCRQHHALFLQFLSVLLNIYGIDP